MILCLQYVTIQYTSYVLCFSDFWDCEWSKRQSTGIPVEHNAKMPLYQPI